jgi:hypothetical protein
MYNPFDFFFNFSHLVFFVYSEYKEYVRVEYIRYVIVYIGRWCCL